MKLDDRFFSKLSDPRDGSDCWLWSASTYGDGYGKFWHEGKSVRAHRIAYEYLRASIPDGLVLDHLCRRILCVNPWHLDPVTVRCNTLRGVSMAAVNATKTHCPAGHEYTADNTYEWRNERQCRTCMRDTMRRYRERRRAVA